MVGQDVTPNNSIGRKFVFISPNGETTNYAYQELIKQFKNSLVPKNKQSYYFHHIKIVEEKNSNLLEDTNWLLEPYFPSGHTLISRSKNLGKSRISGVLNIASTTSQ